ncbi:hypothetical protein CYMTET_54905 [Cymbomonas tetramitiformis]|uniref:Uncharacterized protein n=1 Tax=Cymbomonas tetramitiformis TaxID=36881 RepID=A0AAE0ENA3_9CHLO|nr:hypothetical protein CYMTET_54905 [Cymbomonas tetramitiformis]
MKFKARQAASISLQVTTIILFYWKPLFAASSDETAPGLDGRRLLQDLYMDALAEGFTKSKAVAPKVDPDAVTVSAVSNYSNITRPTGVPIEGSSMRTYSYDAAIADSQCDMHPAYIAHTKQQILSASTTKAPYEHVAIFDIFHPEYYPCLLKHLPLLGADYGGTISKGLRHYVKLQDSNGATISAKFGQRIERSKHLQVPHQNFTKFWAEFAKAYGSNDMRDAWVKLFTATLDKRFTGKKAGLKTQVFSRLDLSRDGKNYEIKPHTDSVMKVVTMLYYLPVDTSHPELGTVVFKNKKGKGDNGGGLTWKEKGNYLKEFSIARKGTFFPNTVFAFAPCMSSWHGVPLVTKNLRRDTVQGFISMPNAEAGSKARKKGKHKEDMVAALKGRCTGS